MLYFEWQIQLLEFKSFVAAKKNSSRTVATPAFNGYSGLSLTVSQNIAKTVNKAQKLARRQKIATIYPAI